MRIAIVRGSSLNKWEMQNHEPLSKKYSLLAIGSRKPAYDLSEIAIPIKRLLCLGDIFNFIPGGIEFLYQKFGDPQILLGFEKAISGFDILHSAELDNFYSLQAIKAKKKGLVKKVVVTCWETLPLSTKNKKRDSIRNEVIKNTDLFIAVTKSARNVLLKKKVPENKIVVLGMGVDTKIFRPKKHLKTDKITILFAGRIVREKGIYELIGALDKIKHIQSWQMIICGQGAEEHKLKKAIKNLNLEEKVSFLNFQQYSQMPDFFSLGDIFVLPSLKTQSWEEQYGMVLVEAMACGNAVITTDGPSSEVVSKAGFVVKRADVEALSGTLLRLIKNKALLDKYKSLSLKRAKLKFDSNKIANELMKIYKSVLNS